MAFPIKSGKVAIPKLDRGPPPPPKPTPSQNREDRVCVTDHNWSICIGHADNRSAARGPVRTVVNGVSLLHAHERAPTDCGRGEVLWRYSTLHQLPDEQPWLCLRTDATGSPQGVCTICSRYRRIVLTYHHRATDLNHTFVSLFEHIRTQLTEEDQQKIQDVIDTVSPPCVLLVDYLPIFTVLSGRRGHNSIELDCADPQIARKKRSEPHCQPESGSE